MKISDIEKIKWKRGEEWFEKWSDTELAFRSFHSNQNPLLAIFHKGGLNSLAINTIWYYSDWTLWGQDKDTAAVNEIILQKLVSKEKKYLKKIKEVTTQTKKAKTINSYLLKKAKYAFLLMHYMFVTDLGGHLSPAIEKRLKKLSLTDRDIEEIKDYLLTQSNLFLFKKEEKDLRKISERFKTIHKAFVPKSYSQLDLKIKRLLTQHQKEYCWIQYGGIDTQPYTLEEIFSRLIELSKESKQPENLKKRQRKTILNKLAKKDIYYFDLVKQYIYLDNLAAELHRYLFFLIATLIKQRFEISYKDLTLYSFQELEKLVKNNKIISKTKLYKRKKYRIVVQINGKINFFYRKRLFKKIKTLIPKKNLYSRVRIFTGNVACRGIAKGKVTIIKRIKDIKKMKKGNILVAPNTNPELVITMRMASAIITDWGGVTSHAAIVSREFGIPCIVGTDIATQVLKDGDFVEVNADKGIVKIIENA